MSLYISLKCWGGQDQGQRHFAFHFEGGRMHGIEKGDEIIWQSINAQSWISSSQHFIIIFHYTDFRKYFSEKHKLNKNMMHMEFSSSF